ncbi:MAG: glycosyltransferase WbuB, partial [Raoultibacter sp.]
MKNQPKKIAVVTMGVKLGDETRGYTRFRYLSELLVNEGFEVDLITSTFQHWDKAHRDCSRACYHDAPYSIVFIDEPGYTRNLDLARIRSHAQAAKNLRTHFEQHGSEYALIYAEIPPNDVARVCAEYAHEVGIPFVADINDLWPEAMRMVVNIPLVSDIAFYPFSRDAKRVYTLLSGAVGTSDEYAE